MALAVASASSIDSGVREVLNLTYPLLADPQHRVADALNVYNLFGDAYAAPSVFVIDTDKTIVWSYVGEDASDRPSADTILKNLP